MEEEKKRWFLLQKDGQLSFLLVALEEYIKELKPSQSYAQYVNLSIKTSCTGQSVSTHGTDPLWLCRLTI